MIGLCVCVLSIWSRRHKSHKRCAGAWVSLMAAQLVTDSMRRMFRSPVPPQKLKATDFCLHHSSRTRFRLILLFFFFVNLKPKKKFNAVPSPLGSENVRPLVGRRQNVGWFLHLFDSISVSSSGSDCRMQGNLQAAQEAKSAVFFLRRGGCETEAPAGCHCDHHLHSKVVATSPMLDT